MPSGAAKRFLRFPLWKLLFPWLCIFFANLHLLLLKGPPFLFGFWPSFSYPGAVVGSYGPGGGGGVGVAVGRGGREVGAGGGVQGGDARLGVQALL